MPKVVAECLPKGRDGTGRNLAKTRNLLSPCIKVLVKGPSPCWGKPSSRLRRTILSRERSVALWDPSRGQTWGTRSDHWTVLNRSDVFHIVRDSSGMFILWTLSSIICLCVTPYVCVRNQECKPQPHCVTASVYVSRRIPSQKHIVYTGLVLHPTLTYPSYLP